MSCSRRVAMFRLLAPIVALLTAMSVSRTTQGKDKKEPGLNGVWSPDHKTLAGVQSQQSLATPAGANFCLYSNSQPVYPNDFKPWPKATYVRIHLFCPRRNGRRTAAGWRLSRRFLIGNIPIFSASIGTEQQR